MILDPVYFLFLLPAILLALWAQLRVKAAYSRAAEIAPMSGYTGARAAREVLDINGLQNVRIEQVPGHLSDHYDPRGKVLRLSPGVYGGRSLAALGIAAHEAGHALQDAKGYAPLAIRAGLVPMAMVGPQLAMLLFLIGMVMMWASGGGGFGSALVLAAIGIFSAVVLFQLVNLPVEFDASRRAKATLVEYGLVHESEMEPVRGVLNAAAWTYVAATLTAIMTLLYFIMRSGLLGGRD